MDDKAFLQIWLPGVIIQAHFETTAEAINQQEAIADAHTDARPAISTEAHATPVTFKALNGTFTIMPMSVIGMHVVEFAVERRQRIKVFKWQTETEKVIKEACQIVTPGFTMPRPPGMLEQ